MSGAARQRNRLRSAARGAEEHEDSPPAEDGPSNPTETMQAETQAASIAEAILSQPPLTGSRPSIEPFSPSGVDTPRTIDDPEDLIVAERHEQLRRMVQTKRLMDEIPLMEAELRGEIPTQLVDIPGTTQPAR